MKIYQASLNRYRLHILDKASPHNLATDVTDDIEIDAIDESHARDAAVTKYHCAVETYRTQGITLHCPWRRTDLSDCTHIACYL